MADETNKMKPDVEGAHALTTAPRWRGIAIGVLVALLAFGAWSVWSAVRKGQEVERWERVAEVTSLRDDTLERTWVAAPSDAMTAIARDQHVVKLEELLAKEGESSKVAPHLHAVIANVLLEQILGAPSSMPNDRLMALYDKADAHLKALEENYPDAAINATRMNVGNRSTITRLVRDRLAKNREWQSKHGLKPVEPEADVVVLLRTTEGDLRMRLFSQEDASPALSKGFLARACAGVYDGTSLFAKRDDLSEAFVRGGDERTKAPAHAPAPGDALDTTSWGDPSPGEPTLPERGRWRILHTKGVVSAWHDVAESTDDPTQFLICAKDSTSLDFDYTPFGKLDEASLAVLERIHARKTRGDENPDLRLDFQKSKTAEQLAHPVTIVKVLVYDKGVLRACGDPSKVSESEKKLETVKVDELKVPDAPTPPTPPTPPAAMDGATDGGMDGAMDGASPPPAAMDAPK